MFLLQRNGTAVANLWLSEPRRVLYWQPHWPAEYVDGDDPEPTPLPTE